MESKVRPALSVKAPWVVRNGMRVVMSEETIRLVELASVAVMLVVEA